ncbi:hypothetical protein QAD02_005650 [Eretmocerus hayati]|uniref:Uncharacterized protein n=1 Tax=Eretmocerus hayati TaxID=131215 RepID=A0ACC2NU45_9HYME|nr:hypothetical protein QAD02_005650 [Eretmocerus hayati]
MSSNRQPPYPRPYRIVPSLKDRISGARLGTRGKGLSVTVGPPDPESRVIRFSYKWSDERKLHYYISNGDHMEAKNLITNRLLRRVDVNHIHDGGTTGNSCLHVAASKNDLESTNMLLDAGAKINIFNKFGQTPLHVSASIKKFDLMKLLISKGADVNAVDVDEKHYKSEGSYPLHMAVRDEIKIKRFLTLTSASQKKPRPDSSKGCYPLHKAVGAAKFDVVELLIEHGADINAIDVEGRSILYYAVRRNSVEILNFLLKAGASIDLDGAMQAAVSFKTALEPRIKRSEFFFSDSSDDENDDVCPITIPTKIDLIEKRNMKPLFLAVGERGKIHIVKMLLDAGADISIPNCKNETTVLHEAVKWGRRNIIGMLLKRGANINALDENGKSVVSQAAFIEHNPDIKGDDYNAILQLLLSNGAIIGSHKDHLRGAVSRGNVDTLRLLFRHGLRLEELCKWDVSEKPPLHLAASNKDVNVLKYLLNSHLFDVNAQDGTLGDTALHVAIQNRYLIHTKVLLECYADPDLCRSRIRCISAIDLAIEEGLEKSVELLLFARTDLTARAKKILQGTSVPGTTFELFAKNPNRSIHQHQIKFTALLNVLCNQFDSSGEYPVPKIPSMRFARVSVQEALALHRNNENSDEQFYKKCIAEIKLMQQSLLQNQITFYDIFTSVGFTQCLKRSRDLDVVNDKTLEDCFPIYGKPIRQRLGKISNARKLSYDAIRGLSRILRKNVEPFCLITEKILDHLCLEDLLALRAIGTYRYY